MRYPLTLSCGGGSLDAVPAAAVQLWVAYQLLEAVAQAHGAGVCHGDITCENVLVTSWNWIFLSDFASYKPTTLPADNPVRFGINLVTGVELKHVGTFVDS